MLTSWRNGSAFDSRSKGWGFDSLRGHMVFCPLQLFFFVVLAKAFLLCRRCRLCFFNTHRFRMLCFPLSVGHLNFFISPYCNFS